MFTIEIIIVLTVLVLAIIMFTTEVFSVDLVALIIMALLILTGILSPDEGVSGFSNPATITVAAMFILSAALFKSGALNGIGIRLTNLFEKNFWLGIAVTMVLVGIISAFINNTPVVAIFIPLLATAAAKTGNSIGKMLIPLSYASIFGGLTTLIGTSTNILVSGITENHGLEPFSMFEMAPMGLVFFGVGIVYMLVFGIRFLPDSKVENGLVKKFGMGDYLTEIVLLSNAPSVGKKIKDCPLVKHLDIDILEINRTGQRFFMPGPNMILDEGDILKVRCDLDKIRKLKEREGIALKSDLKFKDKDIEGENTILIEAVIAPNSEFEGKTIKEISFRQKYGATILALRHRGEIMREKVANTILKSGDTLLIEVVREKLETLWQLQLHGRNTFLIINEVPFEKTKPLKIALVIFTLLAIVLLSTFSILPIMVAAISGSILLIATRCISMREAYKAIDWKVIFLLAGALSLGIAMDKSGTSALISKFLINVIGPWGPMAVVSILFLLTSMLTEVMSNNASAVLLTPLAIAIAIEMNVDPRPMIMAVTFAASASFMTPIGYQTNTMIYGAGNYRFFDFVKVGTPLNLLFWLLATWLIPYFYPF